MRPQHGHGITPLNGNRNMLTEKNSGSRFLSNSIDLNPRSADSFQAASPHVPKVSITTGTTSCVGRREEYFAIFEDSAVIAAAPALKRVDERWDGARVSGHVKPQARHFPLCQGARVTPSGRFLFIYIILQPIAFQYHFQQPMTFLLHNYSLFI